MISKVNSISLLGVNGVIVDIETDIQGGLPNFQMVGLPDLVVKESKERVRSAITNARLQFPMSRIVTNFAPGYLKKEGTHLDLAIAMGILIANGNIKNANTSKTIFIGELSLYGEIRRVNGVLPMLIEAKNKGFKEVFIPYDNRNEVCIDGMDIYPVSMITEIVDFYNDGIELEKLDMSNMEYKNDYTLEIDFNEVKGQRVAKRAMEVAVSGGHNILMIGPPGGGKTMMAKRIPTILPELTYQEAVEVTKIYSISGMLDNSTGLKLIPPFRSPHHNASTASLIGGGSNPVPGEVSLAHNGVLFLDELPEYRRDALEALRQPMEDGKVCISRVMGKYQFPARLMLVASMNPCPCGYYGYQLKECRCSPLQIRNYLNKVSGPLLDRIDIHIQIEPINFEDIKSKNEEELSKDIKNRVVKTRQLQQERFKGNSIFCNAQMKTKDIKNYCQIDKEGLNLLENAFKTMVLSTRAYNKIIKVARTIADMEDVEKINEKHIAEAIQYRILDRKYW